ncbi:MAG: hypothetical protein NTV48_03570 [Candidatus Vogelbacteria bacterium]|nr:hypothetical protein [Candidatus Vogelbacteria bacterium]
MGNRPNIVSVIAGIVSNAAFFVGIFWLHWDVQVFFVCLFIDIVIFGILGFTKLTLASFFRPIIFQFVFMYTIIYGLFTLALIFVFPILTNQQGNDFVESLYTWGNYQGVIILSVLGALILLIQFIVSRSYFDKKPEVLLTESMTRLFIIWIPIILYFLIFPKANTFLSIFLGMYVVWKTITDIWGFDTDKTVAIMNTSI